MIVDFVMGDKVRIKREAIPNYVSKAFAQKFGLSNGWLTEAEWVIRGNVWSAEHVQIHLPDDTPCNCVVEAKFVEHAPSALTQLAEAMEEK